ncbi:MAG TPA: twin-arginine translocase subunit TatC [Prolixibacteraceae bacterium]|nr:MAG: twin arginine-targeting protein translocase TatC [Bacteroidetes bacterium GWB2_41_8]HCY43043.1 twin-arginine translocase subunit TatC [Prolixibacteraceae bacterium]
MSFLDHLEALRWHVIRSFIAIFVFAIVAFIEKDFIFDSIIFAPKNPDFWTNRMFALLSEYVGVDALKINTHELQLISISMSGQFMVHMWTSIIAGFILAFPYVIFQFWSFIKPALYENERRHATGAVMYMTILFFIGVLFGYYLIVPLSVDFLGAYSISSTVVNQINILSYISTVTSIVIAGGVIFELPIIAFFLSKVGLLTPRFMRKYRRHSFLVLLIISAIITPPDIFSQIMVCIPLVLLYEVSIVISGRVEKANLRKLDEI